MPALFVYNRGLVRIKIVRTNNVCGTSTTTGSTTSRRGVVVVVVVVVVIVAVVVVVPGSSSSSSSSAERLWPSDALQTSIGDNVAC